MYPEPHYPAEDDERSREEIARLGFAPDPLLDRLDRPVLGFNVAFHWPLPESFRVEYERLRARLSALDPGVYVYPFEQTHVTVATLVSFKRYEEPDAQTVERLRSLLPYLIDVVDRLSRPIRPFAIDVGRPVLVRTAAFLPILNPGGEVGRFRRALLDTLTDTGNELAQAQVPRGLHSTIVRFRKTPSSPADFVNEFRKIAEESHFGHANAQTLLLTTEKRPYMVSGSIEHGVELGRD